MMFYVFFAVFLLFVLKLNASLANLTIPIDRYSDTRLNEATIDILRSCSIIKSIQTVGLVGSTSSFFIRDKLFPGISVVTLTSDEKTFFYQFRSRNFEKIPHKLKLFLIRESSEENIHKAMTLLKSSPWWNHTGFFLLLDEDPDSRNGCDNAVPFLQKIWAMDILSAVFLCLHPERGLSVYAFNPYTNSTPAPWIFAGSYRGIADHPWILFERSYSPENICSSLVFEKVTSLDGYIVKMNAKPLAPSLYVNVKRSEGLDNMIPEESIRSIPPPFHVEVRPGNWDKFLGHDAAVFQALWTKLKATVVVKVYNENDTIGRVDERGVAHGMLQEYLTGEVDIAMNTRYFFNKGNLTLTRSTFESRVSIVTMDRGFLTEWETMNRLLKPEFILGLIAVSTVNIFFLAVPLGTGYYRALETILRIMLNSGIINRPQTLAARLFMVPLFVVYSVMSTFFQGFFVSVLTVSVPHKNADSMKDLKELDYVIYGYNFFSSIFDDPDFKSRFHDVPSDHCEQYVVKNPNAACIDDYTHQRHSALKMNLHLMKQSPLRVACCYPIRENWPLAPRVDNILLRFIEAGFLNLWSSIIRRTDEMIADERDKETNSRKFRVLALEKMKFAFVFLIFGYLCATVVFLVEKIAGKTRKKRMITEIEEISSCKLEIINGIKEV